MKTVDRKAYGLRREAREMAEDVDEAIELVGAEFVSRAFADELLHHSKQDEFEIRLDESSRDVQKMFEIVDAGQKRKLADD